MLEFNYDSYLIYMDVMMIDEILFTSMWLDEIEMDICCHWFHDIDLCVEMMIKSYEIWIMHCWL